MQVFFIRDGIQFVDLVHALRPNPKTNIQEGWRILDFLSHHPESVHIVSLFMAQNTHFHGSLTCSHLQHLTYLGKILEGFGSPCAYSSTTQT